MVNAIFVWGFAHSTRFARSGQAQGGTVLLRMEDHDRQRSRQEYESAILDDLVWLGFHADAPPVRQSGRDDIYIQALDGLRRRGLVYACSCSRAEITAALKGCATTGDVAQAFRPAQDDLRYPGTCHDRGLEEGRGVGLRVRLDDSVEHFDDLLHGPQAQQPSAQCGDVLVRDREGNWTYQFAATVDDMVQGVTHVIRGDDLLASTGRQLQLARLLGRTEPPRFLHHPLIMKSPDQKLSKSDRDTGVRDLRAQGWTAARVIGRAALLAGLIPEPRDVPAAEVPDMMSAFTKERR